MRIPGTNIFVDKFHRVSSPKHEDEPVFFLTHMHSDHTVGLSPSWCHGKIYCSEVTSRLMKLKFSIDDKHIVTAPLNKPFFLAHGGKSVRVLFLDAMHCPGAVMILFEWEDRTVLHTGDFRYEPQILQHPSLLPYLKEKRSDSQPPLDLLLLDNTYDDPSTDAPKRPAAAETLCQLIQAFPLHKIWLGIDSLGKEELFPLIAKAAGGPVCINPDRLASLQAIGDPALLSSEVVTTDEFQSRVLVMSRQSVTPAAVIAANLKARKLHEQTLQASSTASSSDATQTLDDVNDHAVQHSAKRQRVSGEGVQSPFPLSPEAVHAMAPVIGLVATNWKTQALNTSRLSSLPHECMQHAKTAGRSDALPCEYSLARHPETQDPLVAFVPYSLHSTYSELREFVGALRPRHLIPTSRCSPDQVNAFHQHFDDLLLDSSSHTPRCGRSLARKARPLVQTLQANRQSAMSTSKLQRSVSLPTSSKARPSRAVERKIVKMKAKSWLSKLSIPF